MTSKSEIFKERKDAEIALASFLGGNNALVGIDEAGRGAWAGLVVAAACIVHDKSHDDYKELLKYLRDSKVLNESQREKLFHSIMTLKHQGIITWVTTKKSAHIIDTVGIREANRLAMFGCLKKLGTYPYEHVAIDGRDNYRFKTLHTGVSYCIQGDSYIPEIMIAALAAKVTRDRYMRNVSKKYPEYGFAQHKGYGTKVHQDALQNHGPIEGVHRMSYKPIQGYNS